MATKTTTSAKPEFAPSRCRRLTLLATEKNVETTMLHEMARVVEDQLSDDSIAYNVHVYPTVNGEHFVIGAIDQKHARQIAKALNNGAAWITV